MKRILISLLFILITANTYAEKEYVIINVKEGSVYSSSYQQTYEISINGAPSEIMDKYDNYTRDQNHNRDKISLSECLSDLSKLGFSVFEHSSVHQSSNDNRTNYYQIILSKNDSSNQSRIESVQSDDNEDAYEVARYNLQGVPVSEKDKGIQIIVYSNYTTKTIIAE